MAQDFYAAFGNDGVGQIGSETTINSGDMAGILMIAVQALEKRTAELKHTKAQLAAMAARLEALELRTNRSIQIAAEEPWVFAVKWDGPGRVPARAHSIEGRRTPKAFRDSHTP